ncbi:hypothetical protein GQ457_06G039030 [Hibiscus cannabinus]
MALINIDAQLVEPVECFAFCIGMPCTYRTKLRSKFGLPEAPAPDWVTHFLCEWCALCQEYRELQHRGWDPSLGN